MKAMSAARDMFTGAKGKLKTAVGTVTGNKRLAARGRGEQASVRMRKAADGALEAAKRSAAHQQRRRGKTISATVSSRRSHH